MITKLKTILVIMFIAWYAGPINNYDDVDVESSVHHMVSTKDNCNGIPYVIIKANGDEMDGTLIPNEDPDFIIF